MSTHLITDPAVEPTLAAAIIDPAWLALSAAMTDEVPVIADRDDLLVTIAPGAGHGAPACFLPTLARIEVNGYHLGGVDPATAAPRRIGDRARYGPAWGLLVHERAHAAHSLWEPPPGAPPGAVAAAVELEETHSPEFLVADMCATTSRTRQHSGHHARAFSHRMQKVSIVAGSVLT